MSFHPTSLSGEPSSTEVDHRLQTENTSPTRTGSGVQKVKVKEIDILLPTTMGVLRTSVFI